MKKVFYFGLVAIGMLYLQSCKEYKKINIDQVHQLEDSIPHLILGVTAIQTYQNDDYTSVKITLSDVTLYASSNQVQQLGAIRVGQSLLRILGSDNNLFHGTLSITKEALNTTEHKDAIDIDMKIDSLRKGMGMGK